MPQRSKLMQRHDDLRFRYREALKEVRELRRKVASRDDIIEVGAAYATGQQECIDNLRAYIDTLKFDVESSNREASRAERFADYLSDIHSGQAETIHRQRVEIEELKGRLLFQEQETKRYKEAYVDLRADAETLRGELRAFEDTQGRIDQDEELRHV